MSDGDHYFKMSRPGKSTLVVYDQKNERILDVHFLNKHALQLFTKLYFPGFGKLVIDRDAIYLSGRGRVRIAESCLGETGT